MRTGLSGLVEGQRGGRMYMLTIILAILVAVCLGDGLLCWITKRTW
jgi:hypothetical protein